MRILMIPHLGLRNPQADSNYILYLDLADYFIKHGNFVHMLMPEYSRGKLTEMKGLMYHYTPFDYDYYIEQALIDGKYLTETFSRKYGKYQIDAVITSKPALVPYLKAVLSNVFKGRDIETVIIEPAVLQEKEKKIDYGTAFWNLDSLGYAMSTTVFLTPKEKTDALKTASRWLSHAMLKKMDENSLTLSVGVPCDKIDEETKGIQKFDKFTLFFGGRLNSVKQPDKIFDLFMHYIGYGREDVQIKITTNTDELKFTGSSLGERSLQGMEGILDIKYSCSRRDYYKIAKASHVAVCWSTEEGFPVGFWEQMYMGLPVLFPYKEWALAQLPKDYKFIFKDKYEAYAMIDYIKNNYEEVVAYIESLKPFIRETYDANVIHTKIYERLQERLSMKGSYFLAQGSGELALGSASLLEEPFSLRELINTMSKAGYSFPESQIKRGIYNAYPSDYDVYRFMLDNGYKDLCNKPVPVFVKKEDSEV